MAATYEPLATSTLSGLGTGFDLTSISSAYTDLRLVFKGTFSASDRVAFNFNNDSGSNYSLTKMWGDGTSAQSGRSGNTNYWFIGATGNTAQQFITLDLMSYGSSSYKTGIVTYSSDNNGSGEVMQLVGLWRSTSAINRITISNLNGSWFNSGCTVTLFGIKAA